MPITQYGNYFYLYILLLTLIPAVILGVMGKRIRIYGFVASVFMIFIIIGTKVQLKYFIIFIVFEFLLIKIYEFIRNKTNNKIIYRMFLFLSVLPIIINKLSGFTDFNKLSGFTSLGIIGFMGISYLNFRTIQIIIELYDGAIEKVKLPNLFYFIFFFPTLSSGPIDRSRRFEKDIEKIIDRKTYVNEYLIPGIVKIVKGILYKFVIAFIVNRLFIQVIPNDVNFVNSLLYMYAYSMYLFFDFAGYSSFAIGTSYILGVKVMENFDKPFLSKDMKEFWKRWHISLSRWFGDYIFSRFVINSMRKKTFKNRQMASHIGQLITMIAMGFWHGLTWYYILYGVYQGIALVLTDIYQRKSKFYKANKKKKWFEAVQIFITFHIACFGLLIFSGFLAR